MAQSREVKIISSLVRSGASVGSVIRNLVALTAAASAGSSSDTGGDLLSTHINNVWSALIESVAANTPSAEQVLLVEFVRALRLQKVFDPLTGCQVLYDLVSDYKVPVWTGLPLFGISVRDQWNFDASSCTPDDEACYYNKLTFLARLSNLPENDVEDSEADVRPYDFSLYALWNFRDVFEQSPGSDSARVILLRGASLWMIHCADRLWANVQSERSFVYEPSGSNPAQAGECFSNEDEWTGFNKKRWLIWVKGLEHVDGRTGEDVKELVDKALGEVERVQTSV